MIIKERRVKHDENGYVFTGHTASIRVLAIMFVVFGIGLVAVGEHTWQIITGVALAAIGAAVAVGRVRP